MEKRKINNNKVKKR